jgi:hypothetical protein
MPLTTQAYIVDGRRVKNEQLLTYIKHTMNNRGKLTLNTENQLCLELEPGYTSKLYKQINNKDFTQLTKYSDNAIQTNTLHDHFSLTTPLDIFVEFKPVGVYLLAEDDKEYYILDVRVPNLATNHNTFSIKIAVKQLVSHNELAD